MCSSPVCHFTFRWKRQDLTTQCLPRPRRQIRSNQSKVKKTRGDSEPLRRRASLDHEKADQSGTSFAAARDSHPYGFLLEYRLFNMEVASECLPFGCPDF